MDSMTIFGCDTKGNTLHVKIVRKFHETEVWIYLSLSDGTVYQLPGEKIPRAQRHLHNSTREIIYSVHPDTTVLGKQAKQFHAVDLKFAPIEPMRKWRITFNGTLRKGVANEWRLEQDEAAMIHVRFNFM
jgi:hypothetical protein